MYVIKNGSHVQPQLTVEQPKMEMFTETPRGSNKTILYIALVVAIIVALVSGYMLYKEIKEEKGTKLGYKLY